MSVKKKLSYRIGLALAPWLYRLVCRLLFMTCRIEIRGEENLHAFDKSGKPFIIAFWHYSIFYTIQQHRGRKWVAMVSASDDGEFIARILENVGFKTVRGSKNKAGVAALRALMREVKKGGRNAAIVADGSQGPPLEAQAGAVLLASKTGAPIITFGWGADRYITFRSWDKTVLPKPFARIVVRWGEPFYVPAGLKADGLEEYRLKMEGHLLENYREVWGAFGIKEH